MSDPRNSELAFSPEAFLIPWGIGYRGLWTRGSDFDCSVFVRGV